MSACLLIPIIFLLAWGIRLIRIDLKKLEAENIQYRKSNDELIEANFKLTRKQ